MEIKYITTDFLLDSKESLEPLVKELEENVVAQLNEWVGDTYKVSFSGPGYFENPSGTINEFCSLIEKLSEDSKKLFSNCKIRVADIAFESGKEPNHITHNLSEALILKLAELKIGVDITVYPINSYPHLND